jgi:hypothetical protein
VRACRTCFDRDDFATALLVARQFVQALRLSTAMMTRPIKNSRRNFCSTRRTNLKNPLALKRPQPNFPKALEERSQIETRAVALLKKTFVGSLEFGCVFSFSQMANF